MPNPEENPMADCKNSAFVVSYEDSIFHFWLPSKLYCLGAHLIAIGQTDPYFLSVTFSQVHFTSLLSSKLSGQGWWLFAPCMTRLKANIVWFEPIFIVDYLVLMQPCYVQKQKEFKETCVLVSYILKWWGPTKRALDLGACLFVGTVHCQEHLFW